MKSWTDPTPADGDVINTTHITDLRSEIQKLSLWMPQLDERPMRGLRREQRKLSANVEVTILDLVGYGCIRELYFVGVASNNFKDTRLRIYTDSESSPRIDCTFAEFCFGKSAYTDNINTPEFGWNHALNNTWPSGRDRTLFHSCYRLTPIPYHGNIKITLTPTTYESVGYWQIKTNHSDSIDYDYGRYNYLNTSIVRGRVVTLSDPWATLLNVSNKQGTLWSSYQHMNNTGVPYFLEGEQQIYIDRSPTADDSTMTGAQAESAYSSSFADLAASGGEDWYLNGWYWQPYATDQTYGVTGTSLMDPYIKTNLMQAHVGVSAFHLGTAPFDVGAYRTFPVSFDSSCLLRWQPMKYNPDSDTRNIMDTGPGTTTVNATTFYYSGD